MDVAMYIALYWVVSLVIHAVTLRYFRWRYAGSALHRELEIALRKCSTVALLLVVVPLCPLILAGHLLRKMLGA